MKNLKGKKVKELSAEERVYLKSIISGDYRGEGDQRLVIGVNEVIVDFRNGLSVAGWIINTGKELHYEFNEDAVIYDPAE